VVSRFSPSPVSAIGSEDGDEGEDEDEGGKRNDDADGDMDRRGSGKSKKWVGKVRGALRVSL